MDIIRFGIVDYRFARNIQRYLVKRRIADEIGDTVLFCQHFPVATLGKRLSLEFLDKLLPDSLFESYSTVETDRGGLVTVHNPGQLIIYPVISLREKAIGVRQFVASGLNAIVESLSKFGIEAYCLNDPAGVFVDIAGQRKKIGYVGLKINRGVSDHGFSVNINNDLSIFHKISSCGLPAGEVTSLCQLNGKNDYWREFCASLEASLSKAFSC